MLGNFSFGDYFKEAAIEYAWTFITEVIKLDKSKLYVTVYHNDDEAYNIWSKFIHKSHIIRIKTNDNFWSMGNTGPCGPCSEIFYDCGPQLFGGLPGTKDQDGDRFLELWNLVFMQFNLFQDGSMENLQYQSIDTGMGLERLHSVIEGVYDNYETSLFTPLYKNIEEELSIKRNDSNKTAFNVMADHMKSICGLISNGVIPSNIGRGYVLRRIIRRAMRYNYTLSKDNMILNKLVHTSTDLLKDYDNVLNSRSNISILLEEEQNKFFHMMANGMKILEKHKNDQVLSGDIVFKLYDTYGFPVDMTIDYMKPNKIDQERFDILMNDQKTQSKWNNDIDLNSLQSNMQENVEFCGYDKFNLESKVIKIIQDNLEVNNINQGIFDLVLDQTVFFGESGGQKGDIGFLFSENCKIQVLDTIKFHNTIIHKCKILNGSIKLLDKVKGEININYRNGLSMHHSCTHILHYALKKVLGSHIMQQGSMVYSDKLRFDFNYVRTLTNDQIIQIEEIVNNIIISNLPVNIEVMNKEIALQNGAIGIFDDKYANNVRVVNIGSESIELCGGTHAKQSGDIGSFYIIKESSVSSGIRRIEGVCHLSAMKYAQENRTLLHNIYTKYSISDIDYKISDLMSKNKEYQQEIDNLKMHQLKFDIIKDINYKKTHLRANIVRDMINEYIKQDSSKIYIYDTEKILFIGGNMKVKLDNLKSKILIRHNHLIEIILLDKNERESILKLFL